MAVHDLKERLTNNSRTVGALLALLMMASQMGTVVACCTGGL